MDENNEKSSNKVVNILLALVIPLFFAGIIILIIVGKNKLDADSDKNEITNPKTDTGVEVDEPAVTNSINDIDVISSTTIDDNGNTIRQHTPEEIISIPDYISLPDLNETPVYEDKQYKTLTKDDVLNQVVNDLLYTMRCYKLGNYIPTAEGLEFNTLASLKEYLGLIKYVYSYDIWYADTELSTKSTFDYIIRFYLYTGDAYYYIYTYINIEEVLGQPMVTRVKFMQSDNK